VRGLPGLPKLGLSIPEFNLTIPTPVITLTDTSHEHLKIPLQTVGILGQNVYIPGGETEFNVPTSFTSSLEWKDKDGNPISAGSWLQQLPAIPLPATGDFDNNLVWDHDNHKFDITLTPPPIDWKLPIPPVFR
jgi:hypothetical protein